MTEQPSNTAPAQPSMASGATRPEPETARPQPSEKDSKSSGADEADKALDAVSEQVPVHGPALVVPIEVELRKLAATWAVYSAADLRQRLLVQKRRAYLVDNLIPERSLNILVGDSNIGKTPLLFQLGLCVASGTPFLGHAVRQGRVLYMDFENGSEEIAELISRLSRHLGLSEAPKEFLTWNIHDCKPDWGTEHHTEVELIKDVEPSLVILDPITALYPDIEEKNSEASRRYQRLRKLIRETGTTFLLTHHLKKPSETPGVAKPALALGDVREWFLQARGSRTLINGCDTRLGMDAPGIVGINEHQEVAIVLGGFGRIRGEIPLMHLIRVFDDDGQAVGYKLAIGVALLGNAEQQAAFARLPERFRFKDARQAYGKGAQATTDFLKKALGIGILRKNGVLYEKAKVAD